MKKTNPRKASNTLSVALSAREREIREKRGAPRISSQLLYPDLAPPQKPQIQSIPGVSAKEWRRYRVMLGGEILASGLTSDEALKLAGGKHGK